MLILYFIKINILTHRFSFLWPECAATIPMSQKKSIFRPREPNNWKVQNCIIITRTKLHVTRQAIGLIRKVNNSIVVAIIAISNLYIVVSTHSLSILLVTLHNFNTTFCPLYLDCWRKNQGEKREQIDGWKGKVYLFSFVNFIN